RVGLIDSSISIDFNPFYNAVVLHPMKHRWD
ncbi:MAG: hypothetical protein ACI9XK_005202, partial [Granulosicoccus sp.]